MNIREPPYRPDLDMAAIGPMPEARFVEIATWIGNDAIGNPVDGFSPRAVVLTRELYCEVARLRRLEHSGLLLAQEEKDVLISLMPPNDSRWIEGSAVMKLMDKIGCPRMVNRT